MSSPRLTVKSIADILRTPGQSPARTLRDQKYPQQEPQVFRTPYYQPAITAVRRFYREGNNAAALQSARNKAESIGNQARRSNNIRITDSFRTSAHAKRRFTLVPNRGQSANIGSVEIRLSADMQAMENGVLRVLFFNCRADPVDEETAVLMTEVAHWVLEQNRIQLEPGQIEVMDLSNGRSHMASHWRESTLIGLRNRARAIASLWDRI